MTATAHLRQFRRAIKQPSDLLLAAEYSRWYINLNSDDPGAIPPGSTTSTVMEMGYAMVAYRVAKWFQTGAYYSLLFPNVDNRSGRANEQHDIAATLRFDITDNWLVKLEGHCMVGTAGLTSALNGNAKLADLEKYWGAFLAKTTAYF